MDRSLELVSFLARSENRVEALLGLAAGPATRSELQAETAIPRATLSRILADFRARDLARRRGHEFAITPLGTLLALGLRSLSESIPVVEQLQTLDPWLPLADLGLSIRELSDASVTLPTPVDPLAPIRRTADVLEASEQVRGLCNNVVPEILETLRRTVRGDGVRVEVVVTADAFEAVAEDPAVREVVCTLLDSGRVDVGVFHGSFPVLAIDANGTILIEVADGEGAIRGLVETENEAVRSWFDAAFESNRRAAEPAAPELLTP